MTQRALGGGKPSPHIPTWHHMGWGGCSTVLAVPKAHSVTFALPDGLGWLFEGAADAGITKPG